MKSMKSKKSKKKIKPKKKAPAKKVRRISSKKLKPVVIKKRRGKNIYDLQFPKGEKTEKEIDTLIDQINFSKLQSDNEFIKITFIEKKNKKEQQSFTHLDEYNYEDRKDLREQIKQQMKDLNYTFHQVPASKAANYWKKMYKLRTHLDRVIIDFDTAD